MRPGWERPGSLALLRVLTNRMREYFTYGSVGGAGGNPRLRMTRSAISRVFQCESPWRAPRHRSALRWQRRSLAHERPDWIIACFSVHRLRCVMDYLPAVGLPCCDS